MATSNSTPIYTTLTDVTRDGLDELRSWHPAPRRRLRYLRRPLCVTKENPLTFYTNP